MSVLFILIPLALAIVAIAVAAYVWSARNGQFDDLDTPAIRPLIDDDERSGVAKPATGAQIRTVLTNGGPVPRPPP